MSQFTEHHGYKVRTSRFPMSTFLMFFLALLLASGIHVGLVLWVNILFRSGFLQTGVIVCYWALVSAAVTLYTRYRMRKTYELPLQMMAEATSKVANGDFSVYVPPLHTLDKLDYLDVMIMDFNRMVEELGSIETLKTDFFSNVSHEIKTPIAVVQGAAENLKRMNLPDPKQEEFVDTIIVSCRKLSDLITNILKLNKLEKQNIQPVMETYDLCEQLCRCSLQFENAMDENEIDFEADLEDFCSIKADSSLLELVWTNLLSNAFKFTQKGGTIKITQTSTPEEAVIRVCDNGCGMTLDTKKKIFEKFYQGDTSHSTSGNGLGLALAFRIVQMMEGTIEVKSEPEKGSVFTVRLPMRMEKADKEKEDKETADTETADMEKKVQEGIADGNK